MIWIVSSLITRDRKVESITRQRRGGVWGSSAKGGKCLLLVRIICARLRESVAEAFSSSLLQISRSVLVTLTLLRSRLRCLVDGENKGIAELIKKDHLFGYDPNKFLSNSK